MSQPTIYACTAAHIAFFLPLAVHGKGNSKVIRVRPQKRGWSAASAQAVMSGIALPKRSRLAGAFVASKPEDEDAERGLVAALRPLAPPAPWADPVCLDVTFHYAPPASFTSSQRQMAMAALIFPTSTAHHHHDRGNALKLIEDALKAAGFYADDSLVVDGRVSKLFGVAGYTVSLKLVSGLPTPPSKRRRA